MQIVRFSKFLVALTALNFVSTNKELDSRIVGGTPADINEYPFQISIQNEEGHFCGGSIISKEHILTAAHCVIGKIVKKLMVRSGTSSATSGGSLNKVCATNIHTNANENDYDYDIAVLKLCKPLKLGPATRPVPLPKANEIVPIGTCGTVLGWGNTEENGYSSETLLKTQVISLNQTLCRRNFRDVGQITNRMFCAGCQKGICDSCQGDSGGPLVANSKLIGIVSWGYGCARHKYPGVYVRVHKFREWIKKNTGV